MFDTTAIRHVLASADMTSVSAPPLYSSPAVPLMGLPQVAVGRNPKPRKPRKDCDYIDSPFRPVVLARDRIYLWSSPHAVSHQNSILSSIPAENADQLLHTMLASLDVKTLEVYGAGLLRFTQFCDQLRVPESARVPASEVLLSAFVAGWAGKIALTTVKTWLAGLHFWHSLQGAMWHGGNMLRITKAGIGKLVPTSSRRGKRLPVSLAHMHALVHALDMLNPSDAAVLAAATTAFWGVCR